MAISEVVDLARKLCEIPSTTKSEQAVVDFIESLFPESICTRYPVESGRDNILICRNHEPVSVIFTTHVDTVPPYYVPRISDDGLYLTGRGSCDAKGIAACMISAVRELWNEGVPGVGLLFLVGEETISDGAKAIIPPLKNVQQNNCYLINGEPTDLKLVSGMKGSIVFDLEVTGKAGHSAYPESGYSAIHQLAADINRLLEYKWPKNPEFGQTTINIGTIQGGKAGNVIADSARASVVLRASVEVEKLLDVLKQCINPTTKLVLKSHANPMNLHVVDGHETCTVAFGSDVPFLKKLGTALMIGPGSILDAHTEHEKVAIEDLHNAVVIYKKLARKLIDGNK